MPGPIKDGQGGEGGQKQSRFSFKNPARQTWPSEIYRCERSRWGDEGRLVSFDLGQIELRVPAILSGEQTLIDAFNNNWDLHTRSAVALYTVEVLTQKYPELVGLPIDKWKKCAAFDALERLLGKTSNFADSYWAGWRRMQVTALQDNGLLLPAEFFQKIEYSRPERRPQMYAWQERHLWEVTQKGYSVVPFTGQSRNFALYDYRDRLNRVYDEDRGKDQTSEILNHPIQTLAANVLHRIAARLHITLPSMTNPRPPCYCYANVYDALYFDCQKNYVEFLTEGIRQAVEYVENREFWAWLCDRSGHRVPLAYSLKVTGVPLHERNAAA